MSKIYTVIMIVKSGDIVPDFVMDTIGAYSTMKNALEAIKELEGEVPSDARLNTQFDVIPFDLDADPTILSMLRDPDEYMDLLSEVYKDLMDEGYMDQLIGEDGNFHWVMTDKGYETLGKHRRRKEEE